MRVYKIKWETDGNKDALSTLPKEVDVPDSVHEEDIADWLSDNYGWLVDSYRCKPNTYKNLCVLFPSVSSTDLADIYDALKECGVKYKVLKCVDE